MAVATGGLLLAACGASVVVRVDVAALGGGSVTLTVSLPRGTASQVEDLRAGLPTTDLRQAGWSVTGPLPGPHGSEVVRASHRFSRLSQVPALVADLAGSGPEGHRPFRLAVVGHKGWLVDRYVATGLVDLRCGLSCFGDPDLAARVGYALGLPPGEVARLVGPRPARELAFRFEVLLPGTAGPTDAAWEQAKADRESLLVWQPDLGRASVISASSRLVHTAALEQLAIALAAAAGLVLATPTYLLWRRHRPPGRAPGAGRPRAKAGGRRRG